IITTGLKKKGGRPWEVGGRFWLMRRACVEVVSGKDCPEAIQTVFFDRVKAGMKEPKKEGDPWDHSDPAAAEVLIPILGSFKTPSFRTTLENLTKVKRSEVQTAAAVALGRMGSGKSIALVANVLSNLKYQEEIIAVADSLAVLVESRSPEPKDRDLKAALSIVLRRIEEWKDWRARYALMPMTRRIRSKSSIPVLIRVLEEAKASKGKIHVSGTLFTAIEESLADLTGFWAPAKEPEKWRSWWTGVASEFVMAPPKKALRSRLNKTKSVGFFGIPVTGNRVVFILDVSGSMLCPLGQVFEQSKMPYTGVTNSRMNKAKEELIAAVNGMTADDRFNVVLFESSVKVWQKKLVPATPKNKKALEGYVKKIKAWGGTALYDGLDKALNIQEQRKKGARYGEPVDEIFLLSDGQPNQGQVVDPAEILDFVTNWNKGAMVRIHTVFLGTGRDPPSPGIPQDFMKPVDLMKAIAKANNGRFKQS
ncbi:MAG: VWA domain-containing protein, partial [Planctomycetota bacterium]